MKSGIWDIFCFIINNQWNWAPSSHIKWKRTHSSWNHRRHKKIKTRIVWDNRKLTQVSSSSIVRTIMALHVLSKNNAFPKRAQGPSKYILTCLRNYCTPLLVRPLMSKWLKAKKYKTLDHLLRIEGDFYVQVISTSQTRRQNVPHLIDLLAIAPS